MMLYFMAGFLLFFSLLPVKGNMQALNGVKDKGPYIEFIGFEHDTVRSGTDIQIISISYFDEDGDLGENNTDRHNLFLTDMRNNLTYKYRIRQLLPDSLSGSIKGILEIELDHLECLTKETEFEACSYQIMIKDRAGHKSNMITTSTMWIEKYVPISK